MSKDFKTVEDYLESIPSERRIIINRLRQVIKDNLPDGFEEQIRYKMIGYVVPLRLYPEGYHVDKGPLPFISLASMKNHVAVYHMGLYGDRDLEEWFVEEYQKTTDHKLDMGKSCIRFKKLDAIPYELVGELAAKITVRNYISMYEQSRDKR